MPTHTKAERSLRKRAIRTANREAKRSPRVGKEIKREAIRSLRAAKAKRSRLKKGSI